MQVVHKQSGKKATDDIRWLTDEFCNAVEDHLFSPKEIAEFYVTYTEVQADNALATKYYQDKRPDIIALFLQTLRKSYYFMMNNNLSAEDCRLLFLEDLYENPRFTAQSLKYNLEICALDKL
ncbi:MAG: hypothetical protein KDJ35_06695 [Alphaproteobacteria bacterium]|nr:hypothetical protein [Alphaproteobacteria bacterium]